MSKYTESAMERRRLSPETGKPMCNCCQAVVSVFAQDAGYSEESAMKAATFFRGGMQMGSVCGAITGGLMALGLAGLDDPVTCNIFVRTLSERHGGLVNCKDLLRENVRSSSEKLPHCNAMICDSITVVEDLLLKAGRLPG